MVSNIKNTVYPNNLYLEINGVGWKHSDEIMKLTNDHEIGSNKALEFVKRRVDQFLLKDRFVDKMTFKEIASKYNLSETKCSQLVASQIELIKNDKKITNYVLKGYNYTRKCM